MGSLELECCAQGWKDWWSFLGRVEVRRGCIQDLIPVSNFERILLLQVRDIDKHREYYCILCLNARLDWDNQGAEDLRSWMRRG